MLVRLEFSGQACAVVLEAQSDTEKAILNHVANFDAALIAPERSFDPYMRSEGLDVKQVTITLGHSAKDTTPPLPRPMSPEEIKAMGGVGSMLGQH